MTLTPRRRWIGIAGGVILVLLLVLALFPWGMLKPLIERRAAQRFGRPVTIGAVERVDRVGFHPTLAIRDIGVPQADWAGTGDFARIGQATLRFSVWPLLLGRFAPEDLHLRGVRLALVRDAQGRTNWEKPGDHGGGGGHTDLGDLTIGNAIVSYADAKRNRRVTLRLAADPDHGLRGEGEGTVLGTPVTVALTGAPLHRDGAWPFTARIAGPALTMAAHGTMDHPLDTAAMTLDVTARAADLKLVDAVIEAGLFHTRPLTLAALAAQIGPRLVPDTRIDIGKIDRTDGTLRFQVGRIIGSSSPPVRSMAGTLTLDHRLLTLAPFRLDLSQGRVTGRAVVDQRRGGPSPRLTLDIRLTGGEVRSFASNGEFTGRLAARVRLAGTGDTIRAAVGRSDGTVGFVVTHGQLPARYAAALGFDAGRALLAGSNQRSGLRCLVTRLAMRGGTGTAGPLVVDTDVSQLTGTGTVAFPDERLDLVLHGTPKNHVLLHIPGDARLTGSIQAPILTVPPEVKSVGNILKAIGNRIAGHRGPIAQDADCTALAARALR